MPKKLTYEFVKEKFEEEGYVLLSKEYINSNGKLDYICPNGYQHEISWDNFRKGSGCPHCSGNIKLNIKFIKKELKKENYELLTKNYKNAHQKLDYICSKGHTHNIAWGSWQQGQRCPYCVGQGKPTIEFIRKEFEKEGCKLLSKTYRNSQTKLIYECDKRHKHAITWAHWSQGKRCPICYHNNNCGINHPSWKGGISCEPYCFEWTSKEFKDFIKERDDYKCLNPDCWGTSKRLSIHHIDYNKKNCGPENLITLCISCNSRANKDRKWHEAWYSAIIRRRYKHV